MKTLNDLCQILGISHYDLSVFLGAPRTTITKVSNAERSLPVPYLLQLAELQKLVESLPPPVGMATEIDRSVFAKLQQKEEHNLLVLQREMATVKADYLQSARLLVLLERMQQLPLTGKQKNWCELLKSKALKKQFGSGLQRQNELSAAISIAEKAVAVYSRLANG